jgi:hypothetical protein
MSHFFGIGTRSLNLPMFTALRRFSILMTMLAEYYVLGSKAPFPVVVSVLMMVGGALFAAMFDLSFDLTGYLLVFMNNVFTAVNGVWMKRASISGRCSKIGVMYYNSLFSAIAMLLFFSVEHYAVERGVSVADFPLLNAISHGSLLDLSANRRVLVEIAEYDMAAPRTYMEFAEQHSFQSRYLTAALSSDKGEFTLTDNLRGIPLSAQKLGAAEMSKVISTDARILPVPEIPKSKRVPSTLRAALTHPGWQNWEFIGEFTGNTF